MTNWTGIIDNIILTFGFTLLIGSMILPVVFKNLIAVIVNMLVAPFAAQMPFYMVLMVVSIVITVFSTLVQKYKIDGDLVKRVNEKNRVIQKELREAQLSGNKNKLKKLEESRMSLLEDQAKVSKQQLRSTGYTVLVSIPLFIWINWYLGTQPVSLAMDFPLLGAHLWTDMLVIVPYWALWLTICSIAVGFIIRKMLTNTA